MRAARRGSWVRAIGAMGARALGERARQVAGRIGAAVHPGRALAAAGRRLPEGPRRGLAALRRRARAVAALAVLAGVGVAGVRLAPPLAASVRDHPYFAVAEIVVTPTHRIRAGALLEWTGLRPGVSIWAVDPAALAARLAAHPWIGGAAVRRELPRRLVIDVAEREPVAILLLDHFRYLDRSGVAFAPVGPDDPLDLPFVTGIEAAIVEGERAYARHAVGRALKLLRLMRRAGLPFRVSEVHIERERGITVFPVDPQVALTFGWTRFPRRIGRLATVLAAFAGRETRLGEIDLTLERDAVVRPRRSTRGMTAGPGGGARRG